MAIQMIKVSIEAKDPGVGETFVKLVQLIGGMEILYPGDVVRPDLLIFELGDDVDEEFKAIRTLREAGAVGDFFLTSGNTDPDILMKAIKAGVTEFFSQPLVEEEVLESLRKFKRKFSEKSRHEIQKAGKIFHVLGGKGGVGTTTVAVNLAVSLAEQEENPSVVLVDLNMLYGEVPLFLSFEPLHDWSTISKNISRLDATYMMDILSAPYHGIRVLPAPNHLNGYYKPTADIIGHLLEFMRGMFDYVVVDGGQSLTDISLKGIEICDDVLLVSVLSLPCLANTNKIFKSFTDLGYFPRDRVKIIINRYMKNSDISIKDAEDSIDQKIFWTIPNDYHTTMAAINQGKPLKALEPKGIITKNFKMLADRLCQKEELPVRKEKKRWWGLSAN
ncbi:AAA family ATPase [Desulfococcus multivorans]|uniref:AAA domain containing protein n=1 Tax=Desulfococcus multivorans DSM 2059 TaxID=1121405 RepID=S7UPW0_DESML|nr:AAA family ATPase [Desulfococcus multivorans]AOY58740.1 response regulator receiver protein [Desulfococcus multivorans]AQV01024.1 hypothetical protein B2D07_09760 [Desulfococcus multivorans]EPR34348.1 AAA domain containing protein [Desulfococcus multivorans DSM 2059]SJZ49167.1 pilus assembly protein CpaE [Desulfococcus multivorans DSM 2059]